MDSPVSGLSVGRYIIETFKADSSDPQVPDGIRLLGGAAEEVGAQDSSAGGQAGGHQLPYGTVYSGVGRQTARLTQQLPKYTVLACAQRALPISK